MKTKENRGITLIALIITVIILLILAGTAISISINGGEIFTKASDTRSNWNNQVAKEESQIQDVVNVLEVVSPFPVTITENYPAGWNENSQLSGVAESTGRIAPIPRGFVASGATGENTIAGGLVIYKGTEAVTDDNKDESQKNRDQYVWIPVEDTTVWTKETEDKSLLTTDVDTTVEAQLTLTDDFDEMKASVALYGGFYLSRYELGGTVGNATSKRNQQVKEGAWYTLYDLAHQDIKDGTDTILKGHMIFGSEHEKVMNFIDINNEGYSTTIHKEKQQGSVHDSGVLCEDDKVMDVVKNIFDLEGNFSELTAEASGTDKRIRKGNHCIAAGNNLFFPISNESRVGPNLGFSKFGVRQALYIAL